MRRTDANTCAGAPAPRLGAGPSPSLTDAEYAALVRERQRQAAPGAAAVGKALTPPKFGLRPPGVLLTVVEDADLSAGADAKRESSALA